jgi:hypothetical protein
LYYWYLKTSDVSESIAAFCYLFEVERVVMNGGWTQIACATPDQRTQLQTLLHKKLPDEEETADAFGS